MNNSTKIARSKTEVILRTCRLILLIIIVAIISLLLWFSSNGKQVTLSNITNIVQPNDTCDPSSQAYSNYKDMLHRYSKGKPVTWRNYRDSAARFSTTTGAPVRFYLNMMIHKHGADSVVEIDENEMICQINQIVNKYIGYQGITINNDAKREHLLHEYISYTRQYAELHGKGFGYTIDKNCPKAGPGFHQVVWSVTQLTKTHPHSWSMWRDISYLWSYEGTPILRPHIEANAKAAVPLNNSPQNIYDTACKLLSSTSNNGNAEKIYEDLYGTLNQRLGKNSPVTHTK